MSSVFAKYFCAAFHMRENSKNRRPKQCFCFVEHLQKGRNMPRFMPPR
jgi:hypothetical protein